MGGTNSLGLLMFFDSFCKFEIVQKILRDSDIRLYKERFDLSDGSSFISNNE